MQTFLYNLGVSLLFTHELDAVLREEWLLLFVLRDMSSDQASWWFVYLHLPIFLAVLYLGSSAVPKVKDTFRMAASAFLPIHAALHFMLSDEEQYHFNHLLSELLIYGAGMVGIFFIVTAFRRSKNNLVERL